MIFFFIPNKKELKGKHFLTGMAAVKALEAILKCMGKEGFQNIFLERSDPGKNL